MGRTLLQEVCWCFNWWMCSFQCCNIQFCCLCCCWQPHWLSIWPFVQWRCCNTLLCVRMFIHIHYFPYSRETNWYTFWYIVYLFLRITRETWNNSKWNVSNTMQFISNDAFKEDSSLKQITFFVSTVTK